jgi:HNH endonuclease
LRNGRAVYIAAPRALAGPVDAWVLMRFMDKVRRPKKRGGCWLWQGHLDQAGYGQFKWNGAARWAHRLSYAIFVGRIPAGVEIDHQCRVRRCVNPAHLELATVSDNRRDGARARNGRSKIHERLGPSPS